MSCSGCGSGSTPSGCGNNGHCASGGCSRLEVFDWLSDITYDTFTKYDTFEVSFKEGSRKGFYKLDKNLDVVTGDFVIVESSVGYDLGKISLSGELVNLQMRKKKVNTKTYEFRKILRIAKQHELDLLEDVRKKEKETMLKARILARNLGLDMKLGAVEYQADGKKATFYYFADGRVDFRELIKVLAKEFSIKIEMRQIGARQEAGIVGGVGSCGRELCCSTWLTSFKSVNTTAARYQNLSINQTKLSGQCGRLKCCLNYELDTYLDALKAVPKKAEKLYLKEGIANLVKTDVLKGVMLYYYENQYYNLSLESVTQIVEMNINKQQPNDLKAVAIINETNIEEENFVDLVGQISISSLDKNDKKNKKRKNFSKNKRPYPNKRDDK